MSLRCTSVALQDVLDHVAGELVLAEKNCSGIFLLQQRGLFLAVCAHDDFNSGIDRARGFNHAPHVKCVRRGNHQHARALDMRLDEHGRVGGVAGDRRYVFCAQFLNDLAILLGHDKGYTLRGQSFPDAPAHSAVADQDNLPGKPLEIDGHRQRRERIVGTLQRLSQLRALANPVLCGLDGAKHQRIDGD